jgi:hypothetical protein
MAGPFLARRATRYFSPRPVGMTSGTRMTHRELISLVTEIREELGSNRAVLEAIARVAFEARNIAPDDRWGQSAVLASGNLASLLDRDDVLGTAYQGLNAPALEAAYRATSRERRKFSADEMPLVTGLYTPLWLAEHLVRETLGKLWRRAEPRPRVRDLAILDPACGTMNFGLAAADVLREMYREEMDQAGRPSWPAEPSVRNEQEIGATILRHNLHGIDIDRTALWLAKLSLKLKLGCVDECPLNLVAADALLGANPGRFDVVVTNPPFASSRNLPVETVARLKRRYPAGWRDLYACFIDRCIDLTRAAGGRVGMLTMQSFMFTGAFEPLREMIDQRAAIESIVHLGPGLFPGGNPGTLQTVAFTLRREANPTLRAAQEIVAHRLTKPPGSDAKAAALGCATAALSSREMAGGAEEAAGQAGPGTREESPRTFHLTQDALAKLPRRAWAYWVSPVLANVFATFPKLRDSAPPRQGLATTDNARFVRYWWEVEPARSTGSRATPGRWFPYAKSGRFRRWYEAPRHRVNWQGDGREIKAEITGRYPYLNGKWQWVAKNARWYGRPGGVTYSYLTSGRFSARRLEPGCIFDVAGSCVFPAGDPLVLLGMLNSSIAAELLRVINPTVNFQVGDLGELPVPSAGGDSLAPLVSEAIELQRRLDAFDETSTDFVQPAEDIDSLQVLRRRLIQIEHQINDVVAEMYGVAATATATATANAPAPIEPDGVDLARRRVSYAIGRAVGRWGGEALSEIVQLAPASRRLTERVRAEMAVLGGGDLVDEAEQQLNGLRRFIERDFYAWHVVLYGRRPVYWAFGDEDRALMLPQHCADVANVGTIFRRLRATLPAGWSRHVDDGVAVNLAPLGEWVADRALQKALRSVALEVACGRLEWSETARGLSPGLTVGSARVPSARSRRGHSVACRAATHR